MLAFHTDKFRFFFTSQPGKKITRRLVGAAACRHRGENGSSEGLNRDIPFPFQGVRGSEWKICQVECLLSNVQNPPSRCICTMHTWRKKIPAYLNNLEFSRRKFFPLSICRKKNRAKRKRLMSMAHSLVRVNLAIGEAKSFRFRIAW